MLAAGPVFGDIEVYKPNIKHIILCGSSDEVFEHQLFLLKSLIRHDGYLYIGEKT